ncbi:MAG: tRNA (guanosine(46)-N7)-methyltransferase TrmB [Clostridiales bacterium]|nr:tRNA (guanosine(46)-N7)-methyltransferase TrmB [Clostridiales bacterium]MCI2161458.1 tRNA (guanosine(46)-N7)-methyltransferase TrmB [Oscillospiraceae bacterium]MCI1960805.1 tRNA (guanosine(46)-N7)-methyltransferase TrmB [Clostridiales bacterium]MCI2021246.1 tRNA (guanosine(46)-N7)-methyltransferase TrmB [Clostridiales bacterium]MCI2025629.1 tRNA (guanosine(46)-N7)-methyltransferase TrmB [Clostridiales bacterium]
MRMRAKPWATPELNACPFFLRDPFPLKNHWLEWFPVRQPLHLELGCGKGWFLAGMAPSHPKINFLGIDMKDAVLAPGKRKIEEAFGDRPISNVALTAYDIERLPDIMGPQDQVERIYINFCNPWPRPRHHKRRLTHPRQLELYKTILSPNGEIFFKTDDDALFKDSLDYFEEAGFEIYEHTYDLHAENCPENVLTEHEEMFMQKKIPIKALKARRKA